VTDKPPAPAPFPLNTSPEAAAAVETDLLTLTGSVVVREKVSAGFIWMLILGTLGAYVALVAPIGLSLALRVQQLDPQHVEVLGYVEGAGAIAAALWGPINGMWSDRVRSRFGRRRPFVFAGAIVGIIGLGLVAGAPTVPLLAVAWVVTQLGWGSVMNSLLFVQADRLPEEQRGKVAGLSGFVQMIASVLGTGLASAFIGNNYLVFLVPGAIGLIMSLLWVFIIKEADSRTTVIGNKMTFGKALSHMVFNPARHPDFAWNWLGRLFFMFGVTFATTYTSLFFASRMAANGQVAAIGSLIVVLSLVGVVTTAGGALLGGFLSDKIKRRRIFVLLAGIAFTAGALTMAFGGSNLVVLITGSAITSIGLGVFSAVDQAILLDILPERDTDAGRYMGINGYTTQLAQSIAPIMAAPLLLIGVTGADKNYGLLFLIAAACTLIGGTIVMIFVHKSN
jgi:MFS family permease